MAGNYIEPISIIVSKRDTSQFLFRTRNEEEIAAIAAFPTNDDVMDKIGCILLGCCLNKLFLRCSSET